jgi:hypothetical protein
MYAKAAKRVVDASRGMMKKMAGNLILTSLDDMTAAGKDHMQTLHQMSEFDAGAELARFESKFKNLRRHGREEVNQLVDVLAEDSDKRIKEMADVAVDDLRKEADRAEAHLRKEEGFWMESSKKTLRKAAADLMKDPTGTAKWVSCGAHTASSCEECPGEHTDIKNYCNGDCFAKDGACVRGWNPLEATEYNP